MKSSELDFINVIKAELDLCSITTVDIDGNVYLGIYNINDDHAFYLQLLYSNNKNVRLMKVKNPSTGQYWYGIFQNIPVEFKSCYTELNKNDLDYNKTASPEQTCIQINFP